MNALRNGTRERERNNVTMYQPENNEMTLVSLYLLIITLNVNTFNSLIKRQSFMYFFKRRNRRSNYTLPTDETKLRIT